MEPQPEQTPPSSPTVWTWIGRIGLGILAIVPVSVGIYAMQMLSELPDSPNCDSRLFSDETRSQQIYCAQRLANGKSVNDLQRAIALANAVPNEHPLRPQSDRLIKEWSEELLTQSEEAFQAGHLEEAIAIAERLPLSSGLTATARSRIQEWKRIWDEAESLYEDAQAAIEDNRWGEALSLGRELRLAGNDYWATVRYDDLMQDLQIAQEAEALKRQAEARRLERPRTADELLAEWESERAAEDAERLVQARQLASSGNVDDLEAAIAEARYVFWGTTHYEEAQDLIATWQDELDRLEGRPTDVPDHEYARQEEPHDRGVPTTGPNSNTLNDAATPTPAVDYHNDYVDPAPETSPTEDSTLP
jgi:hypothetical protein